jgi:hypothetical protein
MNNWEMKVGLNEIPEEKIPIDMRTKKYIEYCKDRAQQLQL